MLQASLEIQRPVRVDKRPPVAISTRLLSSTEERHSWIRTAMSEVARHSRTLLVTSHPDRDAFAAERSQLLGLTELPAPAADLSHVFHLF